MNHVELARQTIEQAYGFISIPPVRSPKFLSLINGTARLIEITLAGEGTSRRANSLRISFERDGSAATDEENNISVPAWYCFKETLEERACRKLSTQDASAISLVLINGSSIHEALHVAYSGALFKYMKAEHEGDANLFKHILNVVEDVKNETIVSSRKALFAFVNAKNEIFFNDTYFNRSLREITKPSSSRKEIAAQLLVFYKRVTLRERLDKLFAELGFEMISVLLKRVCVDGARSGDVIDVSRKIYELLVDEDKSFEKPQESKDEQRLAHMASKIYSGKSELSKGEGTKDAMIAEIKLSEGTGSIPPLQTIDILDLSPRYPHYALKREDDFSFIKHLKIVRSVVPQYSEPKKRGSKLVNTALSRIATDGKIFSTRGDSVASLIKKQPEFVILVDQSGSMSGALIQRVMSFVYEMSKAMQAAGVSHTILGHTTSSYEENLAPIVYHIFSYKMGSRTDTDFEARFARATHVDLIENIDGLAIERANKFFTKSGNRVMMVLSDGEPCSPNYSNGTEHTKEMVKKVRSTGTKVIALSLISHVISYNNRIYGEQFNIDATSQEKLERGMRTLISG